MDIKVGEYVRTKDGRIEKVKTVNKYCSITYKTLVSARVDEKINWYSESGREIEKDILKHSENIIDLIEDEDIVILEYKTPRYQERITRKFEISKIEEYINFENKHCSFWCKVGDKKIVDNICKNIKIKAIVTKEQFKNVMYEI